jgi:nitrite reductase/ring-hydroxylating ferredoxin subunit
MNKNEFVEVAKINEIPDGKMKHSEVGGEEVLIPKVGGTNTTSTRMI